MRILLVSAFLWQLSLSDRRILKNYENKLNAREGEVIGGMVKRYRCIEEYVPIEEAREYDRQQMLAKRRKLQKKTDGIKPKKEKILEREEEVETSIRVKTDEDKSADEEIEKMLHEDTTTTTTTESPIRPQIRRAPQHLRVFEHEKSRGEKVPISQLSPETATKPRSRQFYVYDFDDEETEYPEEDEYYEDRISRRRQMRRRQYAQMRRNPYYYPKRFPYRAAVRGPASPYGQLQPVPLVQQLMQQSQYAQQHPYYVPKRQPLPTNLQPLPVVQAQPRPQQQQPLFVRQPMATIAPPVVMEPAERVDPAVQNERRGHPQRPLHHKLNLKPLPRAPDGPTPAPAFAKGQLEEATPENCKKITSLSSQFGIKDISNWSRSNCPTLQMFVPGATCQQLWHFIDSCHKRRFL